MSKLSVMSYLSEKPCSLENLSSAPMGSDPWLSTKTRGVTLVMSAYSVFRPTGGDSTNAWPRFSRTKSVTANVVCKHRRNVMTQCVCKDRWGWQLLTMGNMVHTGDGL